MSSETVEFTVCEGDGDCSSHDHRSETSKIVSKSEVVKVIDLTPDADAYAAIGATFVASVLGDVKQARKNDALFLLTAAIDIAYGLGVAAGQSDTVHADGAKLRDTMFARVGGPKRD